MLVYQGGGIGLRVDFFEQPPAVCGYRGVEPIVVFGSAGQGCDGTDSGVRLDPEFIAEIGEDVYAVVSHGKVTRDKVVVAHFADGSGCCEWGGVISITL